MSEDGPVLDPDEFDIEDDERVREIGEDRYVVSASGEPPAPAGGDASAGGPADGNAPPGGRAPVDDTPGARGDHLPASDGRGETGVPTGDGRGETSVPTGDGRGETSVPTGDGRGARGGGSGAAPGRGNAAPAGGGRSAHDGHWTDGSAPARERSAVGEHGASDRGRGGAGGRGTGEPTGRASGETGARGPDGVAGRGVEEMAGRGASRGAAAPGTRDPPTSDAVADHPEVPRGAPRGADRSATGGDVDAAAVSRWLASSVSDTGFDYGFDATVSMEGEVSRHRMQSDDVTEAFETLAVWFARNASDADPERALGVLLSAADTSVELPPSLIRRAAVEHDLSADDSIGDLLRAVRETGHVTLE